MERVELVDFFLELAAAGDRRGEIESEFGL